MVWGLIAAALFIPLSTKFNSIYLFGLFLLIGMIGNAFFHPQSSTLMKDFNKDNPKITRNMGIFLGLGTLGYALGPYIATLFSEHFGFDNISYLCLWGLLFALFMFFFVPKMPKKEIVNKGSFLKIVFEILKDKTCILLIVISTVKSVVSICFGTYIPFLLQDRGFNLTQIGLIITLFFVMGAIASMTSSRFEKYIGAKGVIALSMFAILPLTILFIFALDYSKTVAVIAFAAIGYFILFSVGIILVAAQKAMPKYTGVISGFIQGVGWGLGAIFLAPMGFVAQNYGIDKVLIIIGLFAFLMGIISLKSKSLKVI